MKSMTLFYAAFLFFLPLVGGLSKVNNTFHIALILSVFFLFFNKNTRDAIFNKTKFNTGLIFISTLLLYFSLSGLWSENSGSVISEITHSVYIIFFIIIFSITTFHDKKNVILAAIFSSIVILCLLTLIYVDKQTLLRSRLENGFSLAPENVIDMAGYYGIGIFCGLILLRETGKKWLYLPIALLFVAMLLTQSRGPLFSLVVALAPLVLLLKHLQRKDWLIIGAILVILALAMVFSNGYDVLSARIDKSYSQSFTRFGIWENALSYIQQKPWFGWGFSQELDFVNAIGQRVHTTHSLYFATLLKGGIVGGLLLLAVIVYGFYMGWLQIKANQALEASMFLFGVMFYATQGMFLLSNPSVPWVMFWLPLALVMAQPKRH
ncbi:O-antigen ligase family protein [Erwinia rhapontici]|uniref:O-antigen ligase family protein n=1 Tax=Erwinia rhapontici TaxID=55212 RepID=UPI001D9AFD31|nr:O-antigen ligase family protein [Erwinia rhapontici]MBP2153244.1 O-antigen ligase [Erwinia rhapontici]